MASLAPSFNSRETVINSLNRVYLPTPTLQDNRPTDDSRHIRELSSIKSVKNSQRLSSLPAPSEAMLMRYVLEVLEDVFFEIPVL